MNEEPKLRDRVRAVLRDRFGGNQSALARASGVRQPKISAYVAGVADMTGETIDRLLAARPDEPNTRAA